MERKGQEGMGAMTLYLSTVSGVMVREAAMDGNLAFLDLANLSPGLYTLYIVGITGERHSWKVIKR